MTPGTHHKIIYQTRSFYLHFSESVRTFHQIFASKWTLFLNICPLNEDRLNITTLEMPKIPRWRSQLLYQLNSLFLKTFLKLKNTVFYSWVKTQIFELSLVGVTVLQTTETGGGGGTLKKDTETWQKFVCGGDAFLS